MYSVVYNNCGNYLLKPVDPDVVFISNQGIVAVQQVYSSIIFGHSVVPSTATTGHLEPRGILKTDIGTFELWGGAASGAIPHE
jgi:hypothetical protein